MNTNDLWYATTGPPDAKIVLVGEAWGEREEAEQRPFVGTSGTELDRILAEAGIQRKDILCTNVANTRPLNNDMWRLFHAVKDAPVSSLLRGLHPTDTLRNVELPRLHRQLIAFPRTVVLAAGNYALWALSEQCGWNTTVDSAGRRVPSGIMNWRGSMWHTEIPEVPRTKLLPLIHPAAIMRAWYLRAPTVHDLRARVPMALCDDWRPNPYYVFWAPPTFDQCVEKLKEWIRIADEWGLTLAEDIETARTFITCLGLADSPHFAMSIPFIKRTPDGGFDSWWTPEQEAEIVFLLRRINSHPRIKIEGQNFIYDTQYIQAGMGATPRLDFDSMLAQNLLFPGTPKGLDYLSSLYVKYHWYWKEDHKEWDLSGTIEDLLEYNCLDCVRTFESCTVLRNLITHFHQEDQWALKMRTNDLCLRMMNRGVLIDRQRRAHLSVELSDTLGVLHNELLSIIPQSWIDEDFEANLTKGHYSPKAGRRPKNAYWYKSEKQTKEVFHYLFNLPYVMNRKTKRPTSGKEARQDLVRKFPELSGLFIRLGDYESLDNTHSVINSGLEPGGRMRCSFNPGGTETHRLSSSKNAFGRGTNLQNLTKGKEDD